MAASDYVSIFFKISLASRGASTDEYEVPCRRHLQPGIRYIRSPGGGATDPLGIMPAETVKDQSPLR
jgi:hypothetical protein